MILNFDDRLLSDEAFLRKYGEEYLKVLAESSDNDYEINRTQWTKLLMILKYFSDFADRNGGSVEPCEIMPREEHGGVTAYFTVLDLKEKDIVKFCQMIALSNAITIDATTDGRVCISLSVPNVFVRKQD